MIDRLRTRRRIQGWRPQLAPPLRSPRVRWALLPLLAVASSAQFVLLLAIDAQLAIASVLRAMITWCLEE